MAATEKNITTVSISSTSPSSLGGYFTMSDANGAPSRLNASVFNNVVMGKTQSGLKIWVGSSTEYSNLSSSVKSDSSTVFIVK